MSRRVAKAAIATAVALALAGCATGPASPAVPSGARSASSSASSPVPRASTPTVVSTDPPSPLPTLQHTQPGATPRPDQAGGLNQRLAYRWHLAQETAAAAGITLTLTSGYRPWSEQETLWDQAIAEYGSAEEARKWVLPPGDSNHVKGLAIDVGPTITEMTWLENNQGRFGLCRRYANEPWHFELSNDDGTCPPIIDSASEDEPRKLR